MYADWDLREGVWCDRCGRNIVPEKDMAQSVMDVWDTVPTYEENDIDVADQYLQHRIKSPFSVINGLNVEYEVEDECEESCDSACIVIFEDGSRLQIDNPRQQVFAALVVKI